VTPLLWGLATTSLIHVLMILGEITLTHSTAHAKAATHEMTGGRFKLYFWTGLALATVAIAAPWIGAPIAVPLALVGLLAFEHAYVQAGQAVPLA